MVDQNLIFDLGMHNALDADFYLRKGFRVVALEANPALAAAARNRLHEAIQTGQLTIVDCALWSSGGEEIPFYINDAKDDWSSVYQQWAEKQGHNSREVKVRTITLKQLFDQYGIPRYVKCDIEGADELFVRQLMRDSRRPAFVSVEAISIDILAFLFAKGYDAVQIVNQGYNGITEPPQPPREGSYVSMKFNGHMSGLFGAELDPARWLPFDEAVDRYLRFIRLRAADRFLTHGWLDFHVTSTDVLSSLGTRVPWAKKASRFVDTTTPAATAEAAPKAASNAPGRTTALQQNAAAVGIHWRRSLYYDRAEPVMEQQWNRLIMPFLDETGVTIDYSTTLDLAAGHGRNSAMLLPRVNKLYIVDINIENIEFCKQRFGDDPRIDYVLTDGFSLNGVDDRCVTFVYCFDAMVHFDSDVIRSYLQEFRRVLKPGCFGFLHHSNYTGNPGAEYRQNPSARNFMSQAMFKHYALKEGLQVPHQKLIDWRRDGTAIDCFTLIESAVESASD